MTSLVSPHVLLKVTGYLQLQGEDGENLLIQGGDMT